MTEKNENSFPKSEFSESRAHIDIRPDALVEVGRLVYRITEVLDFESVMAIEVESGCARLLRIQELKAVSVSGVARDNVDLNEITDDDWRIANERYAAIHPLLTNSLSGRAGIEQRSQEINVDVATLYRWLERYRGQRLISSLIPQKRGWKEGKNRINESTEKIINDVINTFYLTPERPSIKKTIQEINIRCEKQRFQLPSPGTVRSRIRRVSEKRFLRGRGYIERAKNKFTPVPGHFPGADYPLAVIQIDHTPVDVITVDDELRQPIERAWLTVAIDVYSRMVVGYYLSYDAPSETSVAMCVAHMMIPKDEWLVLHNVKAQWPVWGVPVKIHVDNGSDFRSVNFSKSCAQYGIGLEFRPIKVPRYGGHIERLLGTFNSELHGLPGSTFSSVSAREGYDSEKHSALTLAELEQWLVEYICNYYHCSKHSALGMAPLKKWEIGIFGNGETPGTGLPAKPNSRLRVLLDFLPCFERTVQTTGLQIDGLTYYDEALRPWINAVDDSKQKRKFTVRRDPRDISKVWFFDPLINDYCTIPFADLRLPAMSIWEYRRAKDELKRVGNESVDEVHLLKTLERLRGYVEEAKATTKTARRQAQRRREHAKGITPVEAQAKSSTEAPKLVQPSLSNPALINGDVIDFGDIA